MFKKTKISSYLISSLIDAGLTHAFGVPGDYILGFYDELLKSDIKHIGTTREDTAAFAADGYARRRGIGALVVTYGVGALSAVNAVAGAFAESSPLIVISGAPSLKKARESTLLHHSFGSLASQLHIFKNITCASVVLDDPLTALREIDYVIAAAKRYSKPVYIEIPQDMVNVEGYEVPSKSTESFSSDKEALQEAVLETTNLLKYARHPAILAGIELHRSNLGNTLLEFSEHISIPFASTLTGKSVLSEKHPFYIGIYAGAMGSSQAKATIENADILLMLGVEFNDIELGGQPSVLDYNYIIHAKHNEMFIRHHHFPQVFLADFLPALINSIEKTSNLRKIEKKSEIQKSHFINKEITIESLISKINDCLTNNMIVVSDVGDCLFSAIDLCIPQNKGFVTSAFYTSMGFAVPAALGINIASPEKRIIVLVGDGAFQMTGTELSTIAKFKLNPIVIIFNNAGYNTERYILEGTFNDIASWNFHKLGEVFGPLDCFEIYKEEEFEQSLQTALSTTDKPSLLNVHLKPEDASPALKRLAASIKANITTVPK